MNIDNNYIFIFNSSINNINNNGVIQFYTDSNGMEMMERDVNNNTGNKEKMLNDFYPLSTCISIVDYNNKNNKITLFADRPQLGGGLFKGNIILILNRKTNHYINDERIKVKEKMNKNETFNDSNLRITHLIFFGNNPFSYNNPSKTEDFLKFANFLNRAFIMFKINNNDSGKKIFLSI